MPGFGTQVCSVSSSGIESGQQPDTPAESPRASAVMGLDGSACSPTHHAVTSHDIQEERALKECTFAPRLNPNKEAKSVVAQCWKHLPVACHQHHQHSAAACSRSDASQAYQIGAHADDESPTAASAAEGHARDEESPAAASAAVMYAGYDSGSALLGTHKGAQSKAHQPAKAFSTNSILRLAQRRRQHGNSYAASAQRSRSEAAAACSAVPVGALQQQQHAATLAMLASIDNCAEVEEAQLQAEVAGCDKRLEQCMAARRQGRVAQKAVSDGPRVVTGASGAMHQVDSVSNHRSAAHWQQSALKVVIEAELADGSASRFEVQQVSSQP